MLDLVSVGDHVLHGTNLSWTQLKWYTALTLLSWQQLRFYWRCCTVLGCTVVWGLAPSPHSKRVPGSIPGWSLSVFSPGPPASSHHPKACMLGAPGKGNLGETNQGRGCSSALVGKSLTRGKTRTRKPTPKTDVWPLARNGRTTQLHREKRTRQQQQQLEVQ